MATEIAQNRAVFSLGEIAEICRGQVAASVSGRSIQGLTIDSRKVSKGNLFVAIRGERHDGHGFLRAAVEAGAEAVLVERGASVPAGARAIEVDDTLRALGELAGAFRRRWNGRLVAITGSVGKTSTKELAAVALSAAGARVLASAGNLNNLVGLPMTLFQLDPEVEVAVVELGTSRPGEIARLAEIAQPDIGVVTSVAVAHTEGLGSIEVVAREKASLLLALPASGFAIYSADSPSLKPWLSALRAERRASFGSSFDADIRLVSCEIDERLVTHGRFEVKQPPLALQLDLRIPGQGAALNAAAVMAVVLALRGAEGLGRALEGIGRAGSVEGRLRPVPGPRGTLLLDDTYNSNPESAINSLDTAGRMARAVGGRAVAILGDMAELGEHSRSEHQKVGRAAVRAKVALLVTCGREMKAAAEAAIDESAAVPPTCRTRVVQFGDPLEAIPVARELLRERDVVLIKGSRCTEMERVLRGLSETPGETP